MYLMALAYRTLDLEEAKRRKITFRSVLEPKLNNILQWCKKLLWLVVLLYIYLVHWFAFAADKKSTLSLKKRWRDIITIQWCLAFWFQHECYRVLAWSKEVTVMETSKRSLIDHQSLVSWKLRNIMDDLLIFWCWYQWRVPFQYVSHVISCERFAIRQSACCCHKYDL